MTRSQFLTLAGGATVLRAQRSGDMRDPDLRYDEGWTSLFTTGTPNGYVRTSDEVWPRAIECQMYQAHMGRIFPIQGACIEGGEMIHEASKPVGEWNTYEVYSEEGRLATILNGMLVGIGANANPRIGHICLQAEGVPAEFRNIRVRRHAPSHHLWPKGEPAK